MSRSLMIVIALSFIAGSIQGWFSASFVSLHPREVRVKATSTQGDLLYRWGVPKIPNVEGKDFYLEFDGRFGITRFVLECLTEENLKSNFSRDDIDFRVNDEMAREFRILPRYYNDTGYDRGHMAPASNHQHSKESLEAVFTMANIAPQLPNMNRGVWASVEKRVRDKVQGGNTVWVVTGPLWLADKNHKTTINWLGQGHVAVPTHFFKTYLVQTKNNDLECKALVVQNSIGAVEVWVSVDTLESWSGIDFWPELSLSQQKSLESGSEAKIGLGK